MGFNRKWVFKDWQVQGENSEQVFVKLPQEVITLLNDGHIIETRIGRIYFLPFVFVQPPDAGNSDIFMLKDMRDFSPQELGYMVNHGE